MYHYVYKITNNFPIDSRKYYIGSRSSKTLPDKDIKYYGSSKYLSDHIKILGIDKFSKEILSIHETREDANIEEIRIQKLLNVVLDEEYYNRYIHTNEKFNTCNMTTVIDTRYNVKTVVTVEEYHKWDHFISITTNTVSVKDLDGKSLIISKEEYNSNKNKYTFHTKGMVNIVDTITGERKYVSKKEFELNSNYEYIHKNTVVVRDITTNIRTRIPKEIYDSNKDKYISLNKELGLANIIDIYDQNDILVKTYDGNYDTQCRLDGLPYSEFAKSYKSNGNYKLYSHTIRKCSISKLINNGNIKYKGWYAKKRKNT